MGEIMWHRRDHFAWSKIGRTQCARRVRAKDGAHQTRRETENTNFVLPLGECPAYSKPRSREVLTMHRERAAGRLPGYREAV